MACIACKFNDTDDGCANQENREEICDVSNELFWSVDRSESRFRPKANNTKIVALASSGEAEAHRIGCSDFPGGSVRHRSLTRPGAGPACSVFRDQNGAWCFLENVFGRCADEWFFKQRDSFRSKDSKVCLELPRHIHQFNECERMLPVFLQSGRVVFPFQATFATMSRCTSSMGRAPLMRDTLPSASIA